MEEAEAARIPMTAFLSVREVRAASEHFRESRRLRARRIIRVAGGLEYLGAPWRMAAVTGYARCTALGEHNTDVFGELRAAIAGGPAPSDPIREAVMSCATGRASGSST